jgi:hypothetical protein
MHGVHSFDGLIWANVCYLKPLETVTNLCKEETGTTMQL